MTPQLSIEDNAFRIRHATQRRSAYPAYVNNGPQWLPTIPKGWSIKRLKFAILFPAKSETRSLPPTHPVSFVPMEAIGEYGGLRLRETRPLEAVLSGYTYFRDGDVVVAKITPCFENGKGALADGLESGVGFGTTELHVLRASDEVLPKFLFYLTMSRDFRELGTAEMYGAGGQKRVPESFIRDLRHPIPPLPEQTIIIDFLDHMTARIDRLIAEKMRLIELLAEKRGSLMSDVLRMSTEVPRLLVKRLISFTTSGSRGWADFYSDDGDFFIQSGNLDRRLGLDLTTVQHIKPPQGAEAERTKLRRHDVLVCITGAFTGNVAVVDQEPPTSYINQHLTILRPTTDKVVPRYLAYFLASPIGQSYFRSAQYGGTKQGLGFADIHSIPVPVPSLNHQRDCVNRIDMAVHLMERSRIAVATAIDHLREYRSALISAAVTGRVDLRQREEEA